MPTFVLTVASVSAALTLAVPSTLANVAVASPVKLKFLAVCHFVALLALPVIAPLTVRLGAFTFLLNVQSSVALAYTIVAFAPATVKPAPSA